MIFDLDGVLCDLCDIHYNALNKALKETCGFEISYKEHLQRFNGRPTIVKLSMLLEDGSIRPDNIFNIQELKKRYTNDLVIDLKEDKKLQAIVLYLLSRNLHIACCTNSIRQFTNDILTKLGIIKAFHAIISNEDVNNHKPIAECYIKAMVDTVALPCETVIFEDSPIGLKAAKTTGARVIEVKNTKELTLNLIKEILED